ncbi:OpgC domain-containing protein [Microbacterium thalli]|uniref:OpgC domain-containing protein n=1 Tax=Microbacterium thalli TaxID=3027921 RepID=UPI0023664651|nr:OpgC domain-containing protein [Microbacterium thalli]MDD7929873.1 OpgC domain-containing protein [Microbacterium thalli]
MPARLKRAIGGMLSAIGLAVAVMLIAAPAAQAAADDPADVSADDGLWWGAELDWGADGPDGYADRLGETPAMYSIRLSYPLDERARQDWMRAATSASAQGAVLVLSMEPRTILGDLTRDDAIAFNEMLERINRDYDTHQLVRFAPEMNGSWEEWGQQPREFVRAFETVADVVHDGASDAEMVWAPSYGAGYPFERADGRLEELTATDRRLLDTDGDGLLTEADDPYGPYFPDPDAVDRVGLTMFYFGKGEAGAAAGRDVPLQGNEAPEPGEVAERFAERWGYTVPQPASFYDRFAVDEDRPLLLDTGALYDFALTGDSELAVKQGWWRQVLAEAASHPRLNAITWLETVRTEAEAGAKEVDWRVTASSELAGALRTDLDAAGVRWGPITQVITPQEGSASTVQVRQGNDEMNWITGSAAVLAIAFLLSGVIGRLRPAWRYPDDSATRDLRIDMVRGFVIIVVVVTHIEVLSPYSLASLNVIGAITGAELFVLLSGIVLGMVFPAAVRRGGEWAAAVGAWARARKQYLVALAVILIVFILSFVPFIDATPVTTFTDRGTGADGEATTGRVYDLYPNADRLLDYPPPWYAVRQFLLLEMGPWPFNIMGLFVVLSLAYPAIMWLIKRRMWWLVLALSWGLYAVHVFVPGFAPLPSQFNAVFPLLAWQVLFTHGLVIGYYRRQIIAALTSRPGKILVGVFVVAYAGFLVYLWAGDRYGFTPTPFPADLYAMLYDSGYQRIDLNWGRLIDLPLVLVSSYAVLTVAWKPIDRIMGWLWIPLGQASLYVFIVHVFFVLAVANIPGLDRQSFWQGTLIHTAVIAIILLMVKRKFLFSVIPR